ncbi:RluA family pseudouridine synthase [Niallia sp. Krafla_26]|uniref:RluA family pseudouridine synthase n=1 Tax=Niallia sp. Krafla_26 TaxID=3064703 RepID=UPI003D16866D
MIQTKRKGEWFEILIPEEWATYTVQDFFRHVWQAPKKQVHTLRMEKKVKVNNAEANWTQPLQVNDVLTIQFFQNEEFPVQPSYYEITVLHEDDHLLVVNKPAGMDTHPNSPTQNDTLANAVAYYLQSKGELRAFKHVHRLDKDTTGAVLFAKHPFIGAILDGMLEKREIKRTYVALVHGILKNKKGTIRESIGRDRHHPTRRRVSPTGQEAITHYQLVKTDSKRNLSLVQCSLDTGRTHQIRVHFSHIGHPLAGDILYGGKPIFLRQALHAVKIQLIHPFTKETITCPAPFLDEPKIFSDLDPYSI